MLRVFAVALGVLTFGTGLFAQSSPTRANPNKPRRAFELEAELVAYVKADDYRPASVATRPRIVPARRPAVSVVARPAPRVVARPAPSVVSKSKLPANFNLPSIERTAFNLINRKRMANRLPALNWNNQLASIARLHSRNMAQRKFLGHRGLDGKMVTDRANDAHLGAWVSIGENIASNRGHDDPAAKAFENWLSSAAHRQNLYRSTWKESAIGVAVAADGTFYFTQVFLSR